MEDHRSNFMKDKNPFLLIFVYGNWTEGTRTRVLVLSSSTCYVFVPNSSGGWTVRLSLDPYG